MKVTVKLFANFRNGRFEIEDRQYPEGATVGTVVDGLDLSRHELGIVLVNSRHVSVEHPLAEGDTLALFPLVGGG
jgi:sulfur-carrier protein